MPKFHVMGTRISAVYESIEASSLQDAIRKYKVNNPDVTPVEIFDVNSDADYTVAGKCLKCGEYMIDEASYDVNLDPCCIGCGGAYD